MNWLLSKLFPPDPKHLFPVDKRDARTSERFMERKQNDCMPAQFLPQRPAGFVSAERWITNFREMPKVHGKLPVRRGRQS